MAHFSISHGNHQLPGRDRNPNWTGPRREWHTATSSRGKWVRCRLSAVRR